MDRLQAWPTELRQPFFMDEHEHTKTGYLARRCCRRYKGTRGARWLQVRLPPLLLGEKEGFSAGGGCQPW